MHYKRKDGTFQVDQLVSDAKKHGAVPLYCLYFYWKVIDPGKPNWPCGSFKKNSRLFGASWMAVKDVQVLKLKGIDTLKSVARSLRPFHCLFCCQGYARGDLPARAISFLRAGGYLTDEVSKLRNEPHHYVAQMLRQSAGMKDFVDLPDEDPYRVTVIREHD